MFQLGTSPTPPTPANPGSHAGTGATAVALMSPAPAPMAWMETATASDIVAWAVERFGSRLCVAASFTDTVLIDVVQRVDPDIPVFFADTGFHFAETLLTLKKAQVRYQLDLRVIRPEPGSPSVWADGSETCCAARKVAPLLQAMVDQGFSVWLTGLRRAESPSRTATPVLVAGSHGLTKIAPLVRWSDDEVARYTAAHALIANPLTEQGYPSIGCWPCTEPATGPDGRSGRWTDSHRTECGLHEHASAETLSLRTRERVS